MLEDLKSKNKKICVVGLGYVGLPVALEFAREYKVIGFDIREDRIEKLRHGIDPNKELDPSDFEGCDIYFTSRAEKIKEASFYIIAVPTPIDHHNNPDISALLSACETTGNVLQHGDYVVFESTVYPGCTEEDCIPVLEKNSGLIYNIDFKVGYSPERINPGDRIHTFRKIKKVVSGGDKESLDIIAGVYESIVEAGIFKAASIKVAEAAKVIENTQRDINIALMNELSVIFHQIGINTYDVLEAANTKWNFLDFTPGLVGGHCIGVDPYYLAWKSDELGHYPKVILSGRGINDGMGKRISREVIDYLISQNLVMTLARVLVMGVTFKENVSDVRNSKVADIVKVLKSFHVNVDVVDPHVSNEEVFDEYGFDLIQKPNKEYSAIIIAVSHNEYLGLTEEDFQNLGNENTLIYDVKGIYRHKIKKLPYMSL